VKTPLARLRAVALTGALCALGAAALPAHAESILFIGNSFTYGERTAVQFYHPEYVVDLNQEGKGGVPALFKSFTQEAGLHYDVAMETHPGVGLDWHLANKSSLIAQRPYDVVVMHGYSTLDAAKPGDPATLVKTVKETASLLKSVNPKVDVRIMATWSRPDQTYPENRPWHGKTIDAMAKDVRAGYDQAAAATKDVKGIIPVGEAFNRAVQVGIGDANPYDGIDAGKVNLWTYDNYHASAYGYYLEALVIFGSVTGRDPRSLGESECSAFELGLSPEQAKALQQVAFDQLAAGGPIAPAPNLAHDAGAPVHCRAAR
jgi:hypothetical protein